MAIKAMPGDKTFDVTMRIKDIARRWAERSEFGDAVLFIYLCAIAREYLWILDANRPAWILAILTGIVATFAFQVTRDEPRERVHFSFWLLVAVPLCIFYSLRVLLPDTSYDVMDYHIFHSERLMRGLLILPGDVFPAFFPTTVGPTPDIVTGITRYVLGYRLGTITNLMVLVWTGQVLYRLVGLFVRRPFLRSLAVLACLAAEHLLFEISTYMVDLMGLPVLFEALWITLKPVDEERPFGRDGMRFGLLLGLSVALKLTNLTFAVPIALAFCAKVFFANRTKTWGLRLGALWRAACGFVLPLAPFSVYMYGMTGSPVFPYYNALFRSPLWPIENVADGRYGGHGVIGTLTWPIVASFRPEILSELGVYSGRLLLGCLVGGAALVFFWRDRRVVTIAWVFLIGALLWSIGTGYVRYALFLEPLVGLLVVAFVAKLTHARDAALPKTAIRVLSTGMIGVLSLQAVAAGYYGARMDWSGRRTWLTEPLSYLGHDHSLRSYQSDEVRRSFDEIEVWVESSPKTSAIMAMMDPNIPGFGSNPNFYRSPESHQRFLQSLDIVRDRRMFTLMWAGDEKLGLDKLDKIGFVARDVRLIKIKYFTSEMEFPMLLVRVEPRPDLANVH